MKIFENLFNSKRKIEPLSRVFGFDRGKPIDRYYIDLFLEQNKGFIKGDTLEIGETLYSKIFNSNVKKRYILDFEGNSKGEIGQEVFLNGDLTNFKKLPSQIVDCFICTQTLNFIYDFKTAIEGIKYLLKPGGVALVTVAGI